MLAPRYPAKGPLMIPAHCLLAALVLIPAIAVAALALLGGTVMVSTAALAAPLVSERA